MKRGPPPGCQPRPGAGHTERGPVRLGLPRRRLQDLCPGWAPGRDNVAVRVWNVVGTVNLTVQEAAFPERTTAPSFLHSFPEKRPQREGHMKTGALKEHLKTNCAVRWNAVAGAAPARALPISGSGLRRLVNRLQREGVPIASSWEVCSTIRQLRRMVRGPESDISACGIPFRIPAGGFCCPATTMLLCGTFTTGRDSACWRSPA